MPDSDLSYLQFLTFIASIAAVVQVVEMAVDKFSPKLYAALGIFLPLIAVNCAILGGSLFMVERKYTLAQAVTYGFGSGMGWALAIVSMATIRWRMRTAHIPAPVEGPRHHVHHHRPRRDGLHDLLGHLSRPATQRAETQRAEPSENHSRS
jgi:Na+-transporting NADH:ubiquinone oxidoreductase subunit E